MLAATKAELQKAQQAVEDGRLFEGGKIGVRVGRVINKYKMAKHFKLDISDGRLAFEVDKESVREESSLDGLYVIRTSVPADTIERDDVVRCYKRLTKALSRIEPFRDEPRQGPRRPRPASPASLHRIEPLKEPANPLRSTSIRLESAPRAPSEPTRGAHEDAPRRGKLTELPERDVE
jgi:hypothetical protein